MNILLTLAFADGYHGSVFHVYELAKHFVQRGHSCTVAVIYYTQTVKDMFRQSGINMDYLNKIDLEQEYDVLFGVHFPTVSYLLNHKIKIKKLVLNSLSFFELLEMFPVYYKAASMLLTCSFEVRDALNKKYGIPLESISVLENLIPNEYVMYNRNHTQEHKFPKNIAVVSNHTPEEILELKDIMPECEITYFGLRSGNYKKVTPELLDDFDVIISIGKTIQYAMGMGIPAYEYDRFGGNGYITPDNMDIEAWFNFAGRNTCRKLTPQQIKDELLTQYQSCLDRQPQLKGKALQRFLMSDRLDKLLADIEKSDNFDYADLYKCSYNPDIDLNSDEMFYSYVYNYRDFIRNYDNSFYQLRKEYFDLQQQNEQIEQQCIHLQRQKELFEHQCIDLQQQKEQIEQQCIYLQRQKELFEHQCIDLQQHNRNLETAIESIKNSTSWKITAGMRNLVDLFRK